MNLFSTWQEWEAFWTRAQNLARKLGWEGDVRQGPFVAGLPNPDYAASSPMVGWKQDNNGTTFIATEIPLAWLGSDFIQETSHTTIRRPRVG